MTVLVLDARSATWQEIAEYLMDNAKRIAGEPLYLCWQGSDYGGELTRLVRALRLEDHIELWDKADILQSEKIIIAKSKRRFTIKISS